MIDQSSNATRRVSRYFRALGAGRSEGFRVPPFTLLLDAATADRYRNYAFPDDGADPDAATVAELIAAFERRERIPRLEYIPALAPALEARLAPSGFAGEAELPLMLCTQKSLVPSDLPEGAECKSATSRADLHDAAEVQNTAYGAGPATAADVDRLQRTVVGGGLVALARGTDGMPVGSGIVSAPIEGVAEVAAVGVLKGERRQGVGAAVTAFLGGRALDLGIDLPFLMAAHEAEARVYRRIGFVPFATMLHVARGP